jgi:hypothetical protein
VPDLPHTAQYTVQDVSATGAGVNPVGDASICKGDAGGPVLRQGSAGPATLVGIASTSWQGGCLGETSTRRDATITRTDDLGAWIKQFEIATVDGVVAAGTGSGCLTVQSGGQIYSLGGYDSSVVKAGANLHLTGFPAPSATDPCNQGMRFQVTGAVPIQTLTGTAKAGADPNCLLLGRYLLVGGDRTVLRTGVNVQVTGYPDPTAASPCQQGAPFRVLTAVRTS